MRRDVSEHPSETIEQRSDVAREVGGFGADAIRRRRPRPATATAADVAVGTVLLLSPSPLLNALPCPGKCVRHRAFAGRARGRVLLQVSRVARRELRARERASENKYSSRFYQTQKKYGRTRKQTKMS